MNTLTTQSFIDATSGGEFLLVRYRGFENGGSDKVPGELGGITPVPEASSMGLAGVGLIGLAAFARRARRRNVESSKN
jgi:MYXO-CTERM domain-containing protein